MPKVGSTVWVLRIMSGIMVVVGILGLVTSFTAFGPVQAQLANTDVAITQVSTTLEQASKGVTAAADVVAGGMVDVVAFLDNASKGVGNTAVVLKNAEATVDNVKKQVPTLIDGTAATIESASKALQSATGQTGQLTSQLQNLRSSLSVKDIQSSLGSLQTNLSGVQASLTSLQGNLDGWQSLVENQEKLLAGQTVRLTGADLKAWAPWLAVRTGIPEAFLKQEADALIVNSKVMQFPLNQIQVKGDDLVEFAKFVEAYVGMDGSAIRAQGMAAKEQGIAWNIAGTDSLKQSAQVMGQSSTALSQSAQTLQSSAAALKSVDATLGSSVAGVDGVLSQTAGALSTTAGQLQSLSGTLESNIKNIKGTEPAITGVTEQAGQFLNVANQQMGLVQKGLQDASTHAKKLQTVTQEQLSQINTGLKGTADAIKQVSLSEMGGSLLGGLRLFMSLTYVLFIVTGVALFAAGQRLSGAGS